MDRAIVVFSRRGIFQTPVTAREVRSREHAHKLWPLVTPDEPRRLVTRVSPSFTTDSKLRRQSHFRILPTPPAYDPSTHFDQKETERRRTLGESAERRRDKELIEAELNQRLAAGLGLP